MSLRPLPPPSIADPLISADCSRNQLEDGARGSLLIHPRPDKERPFSWLSSDSYAIEQMRKAERDPRLLMVSDWNHINTEILQDFFTEVSCLDRHRRCWC